MEEGKEGGEEGVEVAPGKIGVPVSRSREREKREEEEKNNNNAAMVSSVHSVSHRDDHTWTHSEEKVHYGGENLRVECMINSWPCEAEGRG